MNPFDLRGKVAVVTGSSKGIGRSIATHLARAGARVVISSRKPEPCEATAAELRAEGLEAMAIACHVGQDDALEALVTRTEAELGPIDVLVCNAATNPYHGPLTGISDEAWRKTMDTNVLSVLHLAGKVLPGMAQRGGGNLIVVASVALLKATPNLGSYAVSKAAVHQLVRSLAVEWGQHNIRVNSILPGLVKTDFARALWDNPEAEARASSAFPLGRLGEPDDIGPAAVFLASRAGAWMTGQMVVIDGGNTITS